MHLYDLGGALWRAVPQVVSIDSQHLVVVPQFAVLGRQAARQQVQDENAALLRLADEFDAQWLAALALHQRHLQDGAGVVVAAASAVGAVRGLRGGAAGGRRGVGARVPGLEALLLHHRQPEEGGLPQHPHRPGVRDRGQAHLIHLDGEKHGAEK